jgi:flagella basal body P-ring formation protein FlgA
MQKVAMIFLAIGFASAPSAPASEALQSLADIQASARAYALEQEGAAGRALEVTVGRLDPRLRLVRCATPLVASRSPGARDIGHTTVNVRCESDNRWSIFVPLTVRERIDVLVAARALAAGDVLSATDVTLAPTWVMRSPDRYLTDPGSAIGQVLRRPLAAGAPLSSQSLRNQRTVRRGSIITLAFDDGPVTIRVSGTALQDGAVGERIQVRNPSSRRVVEGIVAADGSVLVR